MYVDMYLYYKRQGWSSFALEADSAKCVQNLSSPGGYSTGWERHTWALFLWRRVLFCQMGKDVPHSISPTHKCHRSISPLLQHLCAELSILDPNHHVLTSPLHPTICFPKFKGGTVEFVGMWLKGKDASASAF